MYAITTEVENIKTVEGNYKNKLIAERHLSRLKKKHPGTIFKVDKISKRDKTKTEG